MHVLRRSSSSHRIAIRSASSILQRTFFERLHSLPGDDQFTLEYSISDKTACRQKRSSFSCSRRRKASHFKSATPAEEHTIPAIEPQRILTHGFPPSSHRPPQLSTALGLGRVTSPLLRDLSGSFRFVGPLCPGVLIVWVTGPLLIV